MDTFRLVPISQIVERLPVRKVQTAGIERLRQSIRSRGLLDNYPLTLFDLGNNTYKLIDGNHRLEAAIAEGLAKVHAIVKANVSDQDAYTIDTSSPRRMLNVCHILSLVLAYVLFGHKWEVRHDHTQTHRPRPTPDDALAGSRPHHQGQR